ncbi:MAG: radical SAM family heme chaperone HemW, partial [Clostridia bacterium]|nr:radical SAM family heme chaperone HemW [Clostridia bacterium]
GAIKTTILELRKIFKFVDKPEITIECNPNSVTYEKALEWKDSGVNRVSIGLQCANNNVLRAIGRIHTKDDYLEAVENIRKAGIENINTDIMLGLPKEKQKDIDYTIKLAHRSGSNHISAYTLILEENTKLYDMVKSGQVTLPGEDRVLNHFDFACNYLEDLGYRRYEVSNFSLPGYECKHNINAWRLEEYVGFGAGAHSYFQDKRFSNIRDMTNYMQVVESGESPIDYIENETRDSLFEEYMMLGLRLVKGVSINYIKDRFKVDILSTKQKQIDKYLKLGFLKVKDGYISATYDGMKVLNQIILDLV